MTKTITELESLDYAHLRRDYPEKLREIYEAGETLRRLRLLLGNDQWYKCDNRYGLVLTPDDWIEAMRLLKACEDPEVDNETTDGDG